MKTHDQAGAAADLTQVVLDIAHQPHPVDIINRVVQLAGKLVDCAAADLVRITDSGLLRVVASSDPGLSEATEHVWRQWPHPAVQEPGSIDDAKVDRRRSGYLQQLRRSTGIVDELVKPLVLGPNTHGYLRFLYADAGAAGGNQALITRFCIHATIALDRALLLTQVENLQLALEGNRQIGAAIGVLMTRQQLSYDEGLDHLKIASQHTNRKLRDVAADVLYTGQLPADPVALTRQE